MSTILVVATEDEARYFFGSFLDRTTIPCVRVESGKLCLEEAAQREFGLILARVPLPDLSVPALAIGLNQRFSLNTRTPLLLLAEGRQYQAALAYQNPAIQVIDVSKSPAKVSKAVSDALGIAMRAAARLDVELELEAEIDRDRRHCRTRDISRSGMLLDSTEPLPIGTEFVFNFTLPERFTPIHGRGQVVRHEGSVQSPRAGMGVKFIEFPEGAEEAIGSFVNQNRDFPRRTSG